MKSALFSAISMLVIVSLWQGALAVGFVSPAAVAYPLEVLKSLPGFLGRNRPDLIATLFRSALAFALSVPIGIAAGLIASFSGPFRDPCRFAVDFLRSIPATALVPLFLVFYGIGDISKIAVGAFSSALVICLATILGLSGRNSTRAAVLRLMGVKRLRRLALADLPEALPHIFLGLRAGISLALILVVVAEMLIGSNRGLGRVIADMQYSDDRGRMFGAIAVVGLIGYGYNLILQRLEKSLVWWQTLQ
jgi:ABC-type nitrate/sulfonate/bicarbonate transport system permease component